MVGVSICVQLFFFFNDTATTEIYTLSLHDALPIFAFQRRVAASRRRPLRRFTTVPRRGWAVPCARATGRQSRKSDRKSTRLNSSHANISYAVFCLKKKKYTSIISTSHSSTSHTHHN